MKYLRTDKADNSVREISKHEAMRLMDGSYKAEAISGMLETVGTIPLLFCYIDVVEEQ